jgi:hypothetical protein
MGKVMVVDDAATVLKVMENILRIAGNEVCCQGAMSGAVPSFFFSLRPFGSR